MELAQQDTIGLVNFHLTMGKSAPSYNETIIARMVAFAWANIVAKSPTPGVSPDLDVCVIGHGPAQGTTIHSHGTSDAPHEAIPIATTLEEFERLASAELGSYRSGAYYG